MKFIRPGTALGALLAASAGIGGVHAEDGPYLAAGYGTTGYQTRCNGNACDRRDNGFRLAAGWAFARSWSAETIYLNEGAFVASDVTSGGTPFHGDAHVHAFGATLGYSYPISSAFSIGARAGIASVKADFTPGPAPAISGGKTTAQFLGGLNATWHFSTAWSARFDWDHSRARMNRFDGDINMVSAGVQFGF
jgi:hypothetical protein